jgi:hypothetical protein
MYTFNEEPAKDIENGVARDNEDIKQTVHAKKEEE